MRKVGGARGKNAEPCVTRNNYQMSAIRARDARVRAEGEITDQDCEADSREEA